MHGTDFDLTERIRRASEISEREADKRSDKIRREQLNFIHEKNIEKKLNTLIDQNEKIIKLLKKVVKQNA